MAAAVAIADDGDPKRDGGGRDDGGGRRVDRLSGSPPPPSPSFASHARALDSNDDRVVDGRRTRRMGPPTPSVATLIVADAVGSGGGVHPRREGGRRESDDADRSSSRRMTMRDLDELDDATTRGATVINLWRLQFAIRSGTHAPAADTPGAPLGGGTAWGGGGGPSTGGRAAASATHQHYLSTTSQVYFRIFEPARFSPSTTSRPVGPSLVR